MARTRLRALTLAALVALAACSSSASKGSASSDSSTSTSTSTSIAGETTTTAGGGDTSSSTATTAAPATDPPATNPPPTNPPPTNAPAGPRVQSATFNGPSACTSPDVSTDVPPPSVSISWVATGADSVYVAIDNPNGPYESNLPTTGSIDNLPFGCPGTHTYYVVAVKGTQKDVEQKTFTAN